MASIVSEWLIREEEVNRLLEVVKRVESRSGSAELRVNVWILGEMKLKLMNFGQKR
jgi:hypothetical protein